MPELPEVPTPRSAEAEAALRAAPDARDALIDLLFDKIARLHMQVAVLSQN